MAKYTRIEVVLQMKENGIVPVFYNADLEVCKQVLKACYDGGLRTFEFTNRGDYAHEVFGELNKFAKAELDGMMMGVGSVLDAGTSSLYIQLGADFIVSPVVNAEMAKACNRRKVAWMPGCGSVSEISYAEELGAEVVKIFPGAQVGGPAFVKGVKGPLPWASIMPTGGVSPTEENLKEWFAAGVHCVGIGSKLFIKNAEGAFDYAAISSKIKEALQLVKTLRS
ncbi:MULTISPECIES: bifunctional 4-hydroxy-2-oxoglutarate aldolase/2-dehydro-3-deoxy-phosphogluconate aldolase [Leeuwenhoekiella]|jgi:2-dehydro-3-deoxyphosphogluconate aldolase/(4S)-4-hydroxy-2-oxoglutarate aldolase|uniref:Keto-hydroxyglutarate-aldolase/keto-deoxy-phosphogluconate aldolase n=1 Tax=Leeuwenhoekiella blandensis (strain CECT 7118 / CCUG 51940 / KCTC 22103 / MED217) TaxID=398720 RepID=A3XJI5_LEEBM|nr:MULTISPECIES: bifunctional 4-hydroxy-2-oxoglutarate aldolase/2-dehydro-3-deoxy-phosphogluconate aldolase [Leeuwenhoekiella]EAQ50286.1 keto-hydroxyglutarate-aldolase/keto-deoxy-phosphogluconate aldolase [Leeuwenhoekiella blandensis MED217]MAO43567.1 bifunctional 4-hydroxy-2-oxoglutarate aldolase/2-dehydro-3-deoxy-phosphogluconate aldolase [Leeuwenhoekiella sp.]HBT08428.1 bifunctional 4-hydroxy-2-oxoglutarate aldolase/2-dehydro-3-deoxy-phosphogluconate aldolase [Leeuwenhoekiella sp.]HCW64136.1|tara:strand:- start:5802 stop:6473 length:672 start_codon:yes stop_codon:yes gene_type:complete